MDTQGWKNYGEGIDCLFSRTATVPVVQSLFKQMEHFLRTEQRLSFAELVPYTSVRTT